MLADGRPTPGRPAAPGAAAPPIPTPAFVSSSLHLPSRIPPLRRVLSFLLIVSLFAAGLGWLGLRHLVWPRLDGWRPAIEARLGAAAGRPVSIGRVRTGFDGLLPRLVLEELRVSGEDGAPLLEVPRVTALISPRTLIAGRLRLALLELEAPVVRVERIAPGVLRIAGIELDPGKAAGAGLEALLAQRQILVRGASVDWEDHVLGVRARVAGLEAVLGNVGRRHRLGLEAPGHEGAWEGLRLAAEIYRWPGGEPSDWRRWAGEAYLQASAADLAAISRLFPLGAGAPASVRGDLKAWLDFDAGHALRFDLQAGLRELDWLLPPGRLRLAQVDTDLSAVRTATGLELRVQQLRVRDAQGRGLDALGEQRLRLDEAGVPVAGRIALAPFEVGEALRFARALPLQPEVLARLGALSASGRVSAASARWDSAAGAQFEAAVDFGDLAMRYLPHGSLPESQVPWFHGLSGEARITHHGGELRVRASDAVLAFPGIFAEPQIPLRTVSANLSWRVGAARQASVAEDPGDAGSAALARSPTVAGPGSAAAASATATAQPVPALPPIEVEIAELRFENDDAAGELAGRWRSDGRSAAGVVDLEGRLTHARAERAARYLPLQIPAEVREWVRAAVTAGRSDDVRLRLRGDLHDFPFERADDGEFSVDARLLDAALHYAPGWPAIEGFQGRLLFERDGMRVTMRSGRVFGVALAETVATIEDFDRPLLVVEGSGEGPALDMLRFVDESPLATRIDDFTRDVRAQGAARLALRLDMPLEQVESTRVAGRVQFLGNAVTLDSTLPPFAGVTGALEFTETGLALRDLSATFLGGPVRVSGETREPGRFTIRGEGRIDAEGVRSVADNPITRALSGEASYRVGIEVNRRASSVSIESDLEGIASALPAPLAKRPEQRMPLRVQSVAALPRDPEARPDSDAIRVELGEHLRLALERERDPTSEKLLVRRAALAMDAEPVLPGAGLAVHLSADEVDLDAWAPVFSGVDLPTAGEVPKEGFVEGFQLLPELVSVVARRVRVAGRDLNAVTLGASRAGPLWRANIGSSEVQGYFSWHQPVHGQRSGSLSARFTRLEIPRARAGEVESLLDTPPTELPGLDIAAEEFVLFDRRLGTLSLHATNGARAGRPVWTLERLRIEHPSARFDASGSWASTGLGSGRATRLDFDLALSDAGGLLATFGIDDAVRGGAGRIGGHLHWSGSPLALDYATLGGSMALELGKGQFLKKDPGIAKLVGVLNLQSLPRRLTLDFRDVFAEGFAFDEITGDVGIAAGIARTQDLVMRGLQARVAIRGSADLARETQALEVEVRPELNAGLASLAYGAMVSPVIGLGSFVAQLALRAPIQQIFSYEYEITGPWAEPRVIEKRRRVEPSPPPPGGG